MREIDSPRLTSQAFIPTLRRGGVFMPDGTQIGVIEGEVVPKPQIKEAKTRAESPSKEWENFLEAKKGSRLSKDEQKLIDIADSLGIELSKEADEVKDPANEETWKPNKLRDIYMQFSFGFIDRGGNPEPRFIENNLAKIRGARDRGEISSSEAKELTAHLNKFLAEAQDRKEVKVMELAKEIAAQEGITEDLKLQDTAVQKQFKNIARSQLNLQVNNPPAGGGNPPFPGWVVGPAGIWVPPGGGGGGQGGGGGAGGGGGGAGAGGGNAGQGGNIAPPAFETREMRLAKEAARKIEEFKIALGIEPGQQNIDKINELVSQAPDLHHQRWDDLREFIKNLDPSNDYIFMTIANETANLDQIFNISDKSRHLIFEALYEKIIGKPDKGSAETHYKVGAFNILNLVDELENMALENFGEEYFRYLSDLAHVRQTMHELNINLKFADQYKEFIIKELSAAGLDFVYNDLAGVNQVFAQIEKVAGNMVSRGRREWLSNGDWETIYREVDFIFDDTINPATNQPNNPDYEPLSQEEAIIGPNNQPQILSRRLTPMEKDRAIRMAKIFHAGLQRRGMYSFLGDLPPMAFSSGRIGSTQDVYIGRSVMAGKGALQFFPGKEEKRTSAGEGSKVLIKHIVEQETNSSDKARASYKLLVFGLNKTTVVFNQYGASDIMSHSWRTPKEFYDRIFFIGPNGQPTTLLALLGEEIRALDPTRNSPDAVLGGGDLGDAEKTQLSQDLKTYVLGQRLYLSVLPRHGNFDDSLKTEIWKKISILKPSTIATLIPETTLIPGPTPNTTVTNPVWEGMRAKLFAAEGRRVKQDSLGYYQPKTLLEMQNERAAFEAARNIITSGNPWTFDQIANYMGMDNVNFSPEEKQLLHDIIKKGIEKSEDLAKAKMSFTFMIDDCPKISLKPTGRQFGGLNDADDIRLMASDQQTLAEGWNEGLNSLIENPSSKAIEHWVKVVSGNARVHGRDEALKTCRPFLIAWLQMARKENKSRWIPLMDTLKRGFELSTSEMTKHFPTSKISQDTQEQKNTIMAAGQLVGMSEEELKLIKEESNTNAFWIFIYMLHGIAEVLGPEAAKEFAKLITPSLK